MKTKTWIGFVVLCLWAGSAWVYDLIAAGLLSGLSRIALQDGLLSLACMAWTTCLRPDRGLPLPWRSGVLGAFLFAIPEIVLAGASTHLSQSTELLTLMLAPAVVVFCVGQQAASFRSDGDRMAGLVPTLAGLGGMALLLPFTIPSSWVGRAWLAGLVVSAVAAGIAAVSLQQMLQAVPLARAGTMLFGVSFLLTASFSWLTWTGMPSFSVSHVSFELLRLFLVDGPIMLLSLSLLREMQPVAFSTRLFLVPWVTVCESITVMRPDVAWYGWLGLSLALGASLLLLRHQGQREHFTESESVHDPIVSPETLELH